MRLLGRGRSLVLIIFIFLMGCSHNAVRPNTETSSQIDKEKIRSVVKVNLREIKTCYEEGLKKNRDLQGKFVIQWTIENTGKVSEAHIKSTTLNSPDVESCSITRLKSWQFPSPPGNEIAVVSYPFVFQSQD